MSRSRCSAGNDQVGLRWTTRAQTRGNRAYEHGCIGLFTIREGKIQTALAELSGAYA
jgi:ketosteroid isomerase-like protein